MAKIRISLPGGASFSGGANGVTVKGELKWDAGFGSRLQNGAVAAQEYICGEVLRFCDARVPCDTGELKASGSAKDGVVRYTAPYAAFQYYNACGDGALRGARWFERGKIDEKERIRQGAARLMGGK